MSNQVNKMRNKQLTSTRIKVVKGSWGEIEPNDYRTKDEFKLACQSVLDWLRNADSRTVGACARRFRGESGVYDRLMEILEALRRSGDINFRIISGAITQISLKGHEIKPMKKDKKAFSKMRIDSK